MLVIVWVCVIGAQSPRRLESISIMGLLYIPYCRLRLLLARDSTAYHYQGTGPPRAQGGVQSADGSRVGLSLDA